MVSFGSTLITSIGGNLNKIENISIKAYVKLGWGQIPLKTGVGVCHLPPRPTEIGKNYEINA